MSSLIRSYRDVWCSLHFHLESDWECELMLHPFDHPVGLWEEHVFPVTVEIKVDDE